MGQEQVLQDILESVRFLRDHAVTKEEFAAPIAQMVTKEEFAKRLAEAKDELMTHIDGFIVLHQKIDTELAAVRSKCDRLERHIRQLAGHLKVQLQDA